MIQLNTFILPIEKLNFNALIFTKDEMNLLLNFAQSTNAHLRLIIMYQGNLLTRGGLVSYKDGACYLSIDQKSIKHFSLKLETNYRVDVEIDDSKYGMDVPIEFDEVLRQEPRLHDRFLKMSMGKQRALIYKISQIKNLDLRIERSLLYLQNITLCEEGKEDFKIIFALDSKNS